MSARVSSRHGGFEALKQRGVMNGGVQRCFHSFGGDGFLGQGAITLVIYPSKKNQPFISGLPCNFTPFITDDFGHTLYQLLQATTDFFGPRMRKLMI